MRPPPLPALTGLRFVLAALVLVHHLTDATMAPDWLRALSVPLGSSVVPIFFALSGFVLTYGYAGRDANPRAFLHARVARLLPAYLLSVVLMTALHIDRLPGQLLPWLLNVALVQSWFPQPFIHTWNPPTWSLSVELVLYATFPLLLPLSARLAPRLLLGIAAVATVALTLAAFRIGAEVGMWLWHPLAGLGPFLVGITLARCYLAGMRTPRGLGLALLLVWPLTALAPTQLTWALAINLLAAPLVLTLAVDGPRWLAGARVGLLGEASYALYILHTLPIIALTRFYGYQGVPGWLLPVVGLALVGLSVAVYLAIERPAREWMLGNKATHATLPPATCQTTANSRPAPPR